MIRSFPPKSGSSSSSVIPSSSSSSSGPSNAHQDEQERKEIDLLHSPSTTEHKDAQIQLEKVVSEDDLEGEENMKETLNEKGELGRPLRAEDGPLVWVSEQVFVCHSER